MRLLREPTANVAETAVPVIIACAEGAVRLSLRLRKPAPGSFIAKAGHLKMIGLLSLLRKRNRK